MSNELADLKCSTGQGSLFDTQLCNQPATKWLFHEAYCDECNDKLIEIHKKLNS